ncbi:MlaD family protein [Patulibacter minatonensis]|uniref:MlaD family protein n=1 Tax=Patulibacter minatonensis TaxID=298163 RepID=UPI00047CA223|nr:MlaD family protein [Patulibacter minatonensis]
MRSTNTLRYGLMAIAVCAVGMFLVTRGGDDSYDLKIKLADANGLRNGSQVAIGGLEAGKVELSVTKDRKNVIADVKLDRKYGPVGKDVRASIASVNLLGQKRVELDVGNRNDPAPDGYEIPAGRTEVATDLDQVLGVLDPDTRTRLKVLINETGAAFAGRKADVDNFVFELPESFAAGRKLVTALANDNHTLADLIKNSDGFVGELATQREKLGDLVDTAGKTGTTLVSRRAQLRAGLAKTPGTLAELRTFLARLETTSGTLAPAARKITATAPSLVDTLGQIEPFRKAAQPTFARAEKASPPLTKLATQVTPVVRQATPVLGQLSTTATALKPVTRTLDKSASNIIGTVYNWAHAVQFGDAASKIFRGEAAISPDILNTIIRRAEGTGPNVSDPNDNTPRARSKTTPTNRRAAPTTAPSGGGRGTSGGAGSASPSTPTTPAPQDGLLGGLVGGLNGLLGGSPAGGRSPDPADKGTVPGLLNSLLGGPR